MAPYIALAVPGVISACFGRLFYIRGGILGFLPVFSKM